MRLAGDYIYIDDNVHVEPIELPVTVKNGNSYVNLETTTPVIGVNYTVDKGIGKVAPGQSRLERRPTVPMVEPVAWAFDPFTTTPYTERLNNSGDNIISPSWFTLGEKGLITNKAISPAYVQTYKDRKYQVWPLLTNKFDPKFTNAILKTPELWKTYAQQLAQYAYIYGFDGYNFDFENIYYKDSTNLTNFVDYLSNTLHSYNIKTSIDVTGYSDSPDWSMVYDRKALSKSVDYVVLMAYDETWASSTTAGPVASYPWVKQHVTAMIKEVPPNKLVLGIPFYMRIWTVTDGKAKGKTLQIKDTSSYYTKYKNQIQWNDKLKADYLKIPISGAPTRTDLPNTNVGTNTTTTTNNTGVTSNISTTTDTVIPTNEGNVNDKGTVNNSNKSTAVVKTKTVVEEIWFENNKSLSYKLDLVKEYNLAGFAAWRKGFEDTSTLELIQKAQMRKEETNTTLTKDVKK